MRLFDPRKFTERLEEKVQPLPADLSLEETLVELTKRMDAARRALSLANKLKDKDQFKKHFSAITANMNSIRAGLNRATRQMNQFERTAMSRITSAYPKAVMREESHNDRMKAIADKFEKIRSDKLSGDTTKKSVEKSSSYWVVKNTETGKTASVLTDENKAWDLADRLMSVGRKHHHIVTVGSQADYDAWKSGK